ncbi:hypothetical protein KFL_014650020 [Klebsormidium nitens]|uniref:Reverse transcriptase Ty1/copia-type domain-containing protein n=1 Tax=Klebsormidium nitens TaxID=105231 RepID=A0A1Y1IWR9_KLENI|nr:hypothetical protein KFL_014650020 [Klebsormidium nitens]|eukprot:GAQ93356.1 hypothetical protein KFL_014650020 [Klebsormidium nitens]
MHTTLRALLAVVAERNLELHQLDVKTAFLNAGYLVWVDDILVAVRGAERIAKVKAQLADEFDVRDLGEATYFLEMELARDRKIRKSLLYLNVCTRPDISQAVGALARSTEAHWAAALGVVRYLVGTVENGTFFGGSSEVVEAFCDEDFAEDVDTKHFTTGDDSLMDGGAVSWSSRLQPTVAASTVAAEDMSAGQGVKEALWFRKLARDLGLNLSTVQICCNNQILSNTAPEASSRFAAVEAH